MIGSRKSMQVSHLTESTLDVVDMDLHIFLERDEIVWIQASLDVNQRVLERLELKRMCVLCGECLEKDVIHFFDF